METTMRRGDLPTLVGMLREQADVRYDVVVPAARLAMRGGLLRVEGGAVRFTDDGAVAEEAILEPTPVFDDGVSDRLGIPRAYLRRCKVERPHLYDDNVNGWLTQIPGKRFLVRGFRTDDPDSVGIARAFLSDAYRPIDNYDVLLNALDGIRGAGVDAQVESAELSERRMVVKVVCPQVAALAPVLLQNYSRPWGPGRAPWETEQGRSHGWLTPDEQPVVFAGFEISNSETGGGAFQIAPRLMVKICRNGLVIRADALREVHLGAKLDEGIVRWSDDTRRKSAELVKAQVTDAVLTFLDVEYVRSAISKIEEKAGVIVAEPVKAIERLSKPQGWSQSEADLILQHFLMAGDITAGGVMQAVTSVAQDVVSPDRAYDLESSAMDVLAAAAAAAL